MKSLLRFVVCGCSVLVFATSAALAENPATERPKALLATAGYSGQKDQGSTAPVSITISGPAEVKSGSEIEVRVTLTNASNHDVSAGSFYVDGVDTAYQYEVRDASGKLAEQKVKEMAGGIRLATLKPGESAVEGTLVSRVFKMSQPGRYNIQLSRAIPGDAKHGVLKSNKITIIINP